MRENNIKFIIDYLKPYYPWEFIFGLLGNIKVETANTFDPKTVQKGKKDKMGKNYTNDTYMFAVLNGDTNFILDRVGWGLFQLTSTGRKGRFADFIGNMRNMGDFTTQLEWFRYEVTLNGFANVRMAIRDNWNLEDCARIICTEYERPGSMQKDEATKEKAIQNRIDCAKALWEEFKGYYYKDKVEEVNLSKSPLTNITMLSPNNSGLRKYTLQRLVPHCTAVSVSAKRIGEIFEKPSRNASCNYGIGNDLKIVCVVEEQNRSWCTSSAWCDNGAITVECSSSNVAPYEFDKGVFDRLIELFTDICKRHGKKRVIWIPDKKKALAYECKEDEVILLVHRWFASKSCPGQWCMDRMQTLCDRINANLGNEVQTEEPKNVIQYVVKKGDTLNKIAKAYGVTLDDILNVNPSINNANRISVGQIINIPAQKEQYHTVNKADGLNSLSKIAKAYGLTLAEVKKLNPQVKAPLYIIRVGDMIRIK